jgi:hypothetical protein
MMGRMGACLALGMASAKHVGPLAESLLEVMMLNNSQVQACVQQLRNSKKSVKAKKAQNKRNQMLKKLGFKQAAEGPAQPNKLTAELKLTGAEAHEDIPTDADATFQCVICHEGYATRPRQMLGVYVFNKDVPLDRSDKDPQLSALMLGSEEVVISTVTHFHVLHVAVPVPYD